MELNFKEIKLGLDHLLDTQLINLINIEFSSQINLESFKKTINFTSGLTFLIGGFDGSDLICLNVFMGFHVKTISGKYLVFQSGFSATDSKYRGQGVWTKLMKFGEEYLSQLDGKVIFGFPNPISHPIFEKKLSYKTFKMRQIIFIKYLFQFYVKNRKNLLNELNQQFDGVEFQNWKIAAHSSNGDEFLHNFKFNQSQIFGKIRKKRKYFFTIKYFEVGFIVCESKEELKILFDKVYKELNVFLISLTINENHSLCRNIKYSRPSSIPLIIKELGHYKCNESELDFYLGLSDTY